MVRKTNKYALKKTNPHRPKGVSDKAFNRVYWPYIPILLVTVFGFVFSNVSGVTNAARNRNDVLAYATSMSVSGLMSATNAERNANGAASLSLNAQLNAAAQAKANDMATRNYWSHNTPEGNPPWVFVDAQGYAYQKIGENLATGFSSESATVTGWMNSPSHKANMLDAAFTEAGFAFANNANYTAAGGGPQTIVVAFYGLPVNVTPPSCPAGQSGTPPNCVTPTPPSVEQSTTQAPPSTPRPTESTPTPADETEKPAETQPVEEETKEVVTATKPVNSDNGVPQTSIAQPTNQLGLMVSGTAAKWLTGITLVIMGATAVFWVLHHVVQLRKFATAGEDFVIHHPVVDVIAVAILALAFTLTQTVGLIQ